MYCVLLMPPMSTLVAAEETRSVPSGRALLELASGQFQACISGRYEG